MTAGVLASGCGIRKPITTFVACGFDHSIANVYFIPMGVFVSGVPEVVTAWRKTVGDLANVTWVGFIVKNLIPVNIGNIIGGGFMVGALYWLVYLRGSSDVSLRSLLNLRLQSPAGQSCR